MNSHDFTPHLSAGVFYIVLGVVLLLTTLSSVVVFLDIDAREGDPFFERFLKAFKFFLTLLVGATVILGTLIIVIHGFHTLGINLE